MAEPGPSGNPSSIRLALAFATIYLVWGSTYLAIRFAVETLPPLLMAGIRFLTAGAVLYSWARLRGSPRPAAAHWKAATVGGALLFLACNGGLAWAEQHVPSGLAALLIATIPLWMVLLEWALFLGPRPTWRVAVGLAAGFAGVAMVVGPGSGPTGGFVDPLAAGVLLLAALSWALGSLYFRRIPLRLPLPAAAAMQMLAGGALLLLTGALSGEWAALEPGKVSLRSAVSLGYLILAGSAAAFSAYAWLLKATTAARVATYAYVNPVVAVFLGGVLADEPLTLRTLAATALVVAAVAMIIAKGGKDDR